MDNPDFPIDFPMDFRIRFDPAGALGARGQCDRTTILCSSRLAEEAEAKQLMGRAGDMGLA